MSRAERRCRAVSRAAHGFVAACLAGAVPVAWAQSVRVTPTLDGQVLWTSNVGLQPGPAAESDFVTTITPGFSIDYNGPRGFLRGNVSAPITIYAKDQDRNQIVPVVDLAGRGEVVKDFFFVEAQASVSQTYFSPFGPRPAGLENVTDNRYTAQSYRVSPYIEGRPTGLIRYLVRDDNHWTRLSDTPVAADDLYTNRFSALIEREPTPFGWSSDFVRNEYWVGGTSTQRLMIARVRGTWRPDPQWQFFVSAGYEDNQFTLSETKGETYGAGFSWRPTERMALDASYEHRFFGASYNVQFSNRTPMTFWSVQASRNISSYPEQLASLPEGTFLPGVLNILLTNRIPDIDQRIAFIRQFLVERGLPVFLTGPLDLYNQQVYLLELASATVGLIGVRNSVFVTAFRSRSEPLSGQGETLPPLLSAQNNNTQTGGGVTWAYQLSSVSTITASANYSHTTANPPFEESTDATSVSLNWTRTISPRTNVHAGARWQRSNASRDVNDFSETAVFAGFRYRFW